MPAAILHKDLPVYSFPTEEAFYTWFGENHTKIGSFWLRFYKKGTTIQTISYLEAVDVALCWGWIDGLTNKYDEESYLIRFTPRRPKSIWSEKNVQNVQRLIAQKRMQPSGLKHIETAKADGRWENAYAGQATMDIPVAFKNMLKVHPKALTYYESLSKANKYAFAFRLSRVTDHEKRKIKMELFLKMLLRGESFH